MTTAAERIDAAATKAEQASEIARRWANDPEGTNIPTESGSLPSLKEFQRQKADEILQSVRRIESVSALRATPGRYDGDTVFLTSEGLSGPFNWQDGATAPDDGKETIAVSGVMIGRWSRVKSPALNYSPGSISQPELNQRLLYRPIDVTNRPPSRSDNVGYTDSSVWQYSKQIWIASRVSRSVRASWIKINDPLGAVGKVVTNAAAVWWLSKVVPDYSGPCVNVTNSSLGTSLDIGFNQDGTLDTNKLDLFLVGAKGLINTWYDQSGNGHNLTSSGANRPVITLADSLNGLRSIVFERSVIYNGVTVPEQFMTIPNTLTGDSNAVSIASLCRFSHAVKDAPIVQLNQSGSYTSLGKRNQTGLDSIVLYQNSSARVVSQVQPSSNPFFVAASLGSGAPGVATVYTNDVQSTAGTSIAGATFTGGKVGGSDALFVDGSSVPQNGGMLLSGLIVWNKAITLGEYRSIYRATARDFDLTPQIKGNIVCDGDSITEGAFASYFNNWPRLMEDLLLYNSNIHLTAFSGGTTVTQNANRTKWQSKIFSSNDPYNLVIVFLGTNDLAGGIVAETVYGNLSSYISAIKTIGYDVIVCTCLPRQAFLSTQAENERLAYNQMIRENWASLGCSYLVDFDAEGTMGRTDLVGNATFYVDGTHPTILGQNIIAGYIGELVSKYISEKTVRY